MSNTKNPRDYEDLKARLGLKKPTTSSADEDAPQEAAAEPARETGVGEPAGEQTPPGGFDLGLERGGRELDESAVDIDKAAEQMVTPGGPDVAVRTSTGMKIMMAALVLVACGVAFGIGYSVSGTSYDRDIQERQFADAETLKKAVVGAKVGQGDQTLKAAFDDYVALVDQTSKKLAEASKAEAVTPALLGSLKETLDSLHEASIQYVEKAPVLNAHSVIGKSVFNGEAVTTVLQYDEALQRLYTAAKVMAEEHVVLREFSEAVPTDELEVPSTMRAWRWASVKVDDRPKGYLVGVELLTDDKGEYIYEKKPIKVPEGFTLPEGQEAFEWMVKVRYDDPKQVGGTEEEFVQTDIIVEWDLKEDIQKPVRTIIAEHHKVYQQMLLRRLFERVEALKAAASPLPAVYQNTVEKLEKLSSAGA